MGFAEGETVGFTVGFTDGIIVGVTEGAIVGLAVGLPNVGAAVRLAVGLAEGEAVGVNVGYAEGEAVGISVGYAEGVNVGSGVGFFWNTKKLDLRIRDISSTDKLFIAAICNDPLSIAKLIKSSFRFSDSNNTAISLLLDK